jgi:multiple sugar transport system substrate-binding protein
MKWISFFYEQPLVSKKQAIRNAKTLVANKQPVGVPALPLFNHKQYNLANKWIKPYINVPLGQMKPFLNGIFKQKLVPEPAASTQSVYHALDAVVESVLTNKSTNIGQMLKQANAEAQAAIRRGA